MFTGEDNNSLTDQQSDRLSQFSLVLVIKSFLLSKNLCENIQIFL